MIRGMLRKQNYVQISIPRKRDSLTHLDNCELLVANEQNQDYLETKLFVNEEEKCDEIIHN